MLQLAMFLLDYPDIESVFATAGTHFGDKDDYTYLNMWGGDPVDGATFDVEDRARAIIRTVDSADIHLNLAWASNTEPKQRVEVLGEDAGAVLSPGQSPTTIYSTRDDSLAETELQSPDRDRFKGIWEYFTAVLDGERAHTRNTITEGLHVQQVLSAIYESAETKSEVRLSEPSAKPKSL